MGGEEGLDAADFFFEKLRDGRPGGEQSATDATGFDGGVGIEEVGEVFVVGVGAGAEVELRRGRAVLATPRGVGGAEVEGLAGGAVEQGGGCAEAGRQAIEVELVEFGSIEDVQDLEPGGREDQVAAETGGTRLEVSEDGGFGDAGVEDDGVRFGTDFGFGRDEDGVGGWIETCGGIEEAFCELPDGKQVTGEVLETGLDGFLHGTSVGIG